MENYYGEQEQQGPTNLKMMLPGFEQCNDIQETRLTLLGILYYDFNSTLLQSVLKLFRSNNYGIGGNNNQSMDL